jgi:hypothetical protein
MEALFYNKKTFITNVMLTNYRRLLVFMSFFAFLFNSIASTYEFDEWKTLYFGKKVHIFPTDGTTYYDNKTGYCYKGFWEPDEKGNYGIMVEPISCDQQMGFARLPIWLTYAPDLDRPEPWPYLRKSRSNIVKKLIFFPPGALLSTVGVLSRLVDRINKYPPYPKF